MILLSTLNARYIHSAFGLRYLMANMGDLQSETRLLEFDINQSPEKIAKALLAQDAQIIGLGVYIWNVRQTGEVLRLLRDARPDTRLVLGGPEVSYETETHPLFSLCDHVITGEADLKFAEVCRQILGGAGSVGRVVASGLPDPGQIRMPYEFYHGEDVAHRIIYVEASRGCPFTCEFCLSSLDVPVRQFPLEPFMAAMQGLMDRGVRQFKFVDRTFNLNLQTSRALLAFFLERYQPGMFFHFEMVPDRLPEPLREIIRKFPAGSLQFEVGIQTFNESVASLISRRQDYKKLEDNLGFLRKETPVHIHADLIVGLPGEDLESFGKGFDRLVGLDPQEIQVGILKRLRGTPIVRHDQEWGMVYNPDPPYEILETRLISRGEMEEMRRFARHWDLVSNSGNFVESAPFIWKDAPSPFVAFRDFSGWLHERLQRTHGIPLMKLADQVFDYLTIKRKCDPEKMAEMVLRDYQRSSRREIPPGLGRHLPPHGQRPGRRKEKASGLPKRQARRQGIPG